MQRSSFLIITLLAFLLVPISLLAQTPAAGAGAEFRVANVDVLVTDASGQRVAGLTRDDFELYENGTRKEITSISAGQPAPRRIVLYFDNASLSMNFRHEFIDAAKAFVRTLRPEDRVMIATWNRAFAVRLPWSGDAAAIDAALDAVGRESAAASQRAAERRRIETQISELVRGDEMAAQSSGGASDPMAGFDSLLDAARRYAQTEQLIAKQSLVSLDGFLSSLAGVEGRKSLVFATEWLPSQPGSELFQHLDNVKQQIETSSGGTARMKQGSRRSSPLSEMSRYSVFEQLEAAQRSAQANQIAIYGMSAPPGERGASGTVEASGPGGSTETGSSTTLDALRSLSTATGGTTWIGSKPAQAFTAIGQDLDARYSLGFRSQVAEGNTVKLDIRPKNPQHRVRFQNAIVTKAAAQLMEERVVAAHMQPPTANDLGILARHLEITADGTKRRVPVQVLIPVERMKLRQEGSEWLGGFAVFISSANPVGESTPVTRQDHEFRWDEAQKAKLATQAIGFALDVIVEPGVDRISIGVLDRESQTSGLYRLDLPQQ
ncbi:MAG: VWA domain-containing protein [Thermoanaerobaculia bacterium]